jgi:hypothetical protein
LGLTNVDVSPLSILRGVDFFPQKKMRHAFTERVSQRYREENY